MTSKKHDMTAPKMTRVAVRVPKTTLDQINDWVDTLGVRRSHFLGIALVAGVRSLIQASALQVSPTPGSPLQPGGDPSGESSIEHTMSGTDSTDMGVLVQMVKTLQSEIADLKDQLEAQRVAGTKCS